VMMLLIWIILNWLKQETVVENIFGKLSRVKTGLKKSSEGRQLRFSVFLYSQETWTDPTWYTWSRGRL
jgi:hypothetical protein